VAFRRGSDAAVCGATIMIARTTSKAGETLTTISREPELKRRPRALRWPRECNSPMPSNPLLRETEHITNCNERPSAFGDPSRERVGSFIHQHAIRGAGNVRIRDGAQS